MTGLKRTGKKGELGERRWIKFLHSSVPAKLLLWGNVIFSNTTTILLACIRSLKSSTEMKIHKRMFFARGDTLCNDTTELSVVEFHNILSAAFVVPALKPQESRKSLKPQEVLEQKRKDNSYVAMHASTSFMKINRVGPKTNKRTLILNAQE